jgi:hypothetical protein
MAILNPILLNNILKYTYRLQKKELREDIINYYKSKRKAIKLYNNSFMDDNEDEAGLNWLSNDIDAYCNQNIATMEHLSDNYINILKRSIIFEEKKYIDITNYYWKFPFRDVSRNINIMWGLLTPNERYKMLKMNYSTNEIAYGN